MQIDEIYEAQKRLIESENVNVSKTNVIQDFVQIVIKIVFVLFCIYAFFMMASGIVIGSLSIEKQIKLENFMTRFIKVKPVEISNEESEKLYAVKNKILSIDKKFPKTSKLEINIIYQKKPNALCLPNGSIYITSDLYNKIKDDEQMLFFVLAHEMGHYKFKDHIMNLRKSVSYTAVAMLVAFSCPDERILNLVTNTMDISDLNYSRKVESRADNYAGKLLLIQYGNVDGAARTLNLLRDKEYPSSLYIFESHPSIDKRIEMLKKL